MRRIVILVLCCLLLAIPVSAANTATQIQSSSTVAGDGSCQVSCVVTINLEEARTDLNFPLPANATAVTVNGASVRTRKDGSVGLVNLKFLSGFTGSYTLNFHYTLPSVVAARDKDQQKDDESGKLLLTLPILSGFSMGVENMDFSVTLPMDVTTVPTFVSGYHQESIEADMRYTVEGRTISGVMMKELLDSETLTMTLVVPSEMFTATVSTDENSPFFPIAMGICAALAAVYWLIFLRCKPLRRIRRTLPPDGITAGEIRSRLTGTGADLTTMVISWAQLGYLVLSRDDSGRIFLHKRMEMGNERSGFENRCFRSLFGRKRTIDGTGYHYARLCVKIADDTTNIRGQYLTKSGNPFLFRVLAAGVGLFAAAAVGAALSRTTAWRIILLILFSILGGLSAWKIQAGVYCLHLRSRLSGLIGLILALIWLGVGALTGLNDLVLYALAAQLLAGFAAAYGGRRTDAARQAAGELLGLRKYLKSVSRKELQTILESNPEYYYELAPYALALGVDKAFARRFGRIRLPGCPYLIAAVEAETPLQWDVLLRSAAHTLDARQRRLKYEKFLKT